MSFPSLDERQSRRKWRVSRSTLGWWLLTILAFIMVIYSLGYLVLGETMFPSTLADSFRARPWGIYTHAFFALFALALGPFQFLRSILRRKRAVHKTLGKLYVITGLLTGISGLYMAVYSFGGWVSHLGFTGMAVATLITVTVAYFKIRERDNVAHRMWMLRSYAVLFSAVTFRFWLGILVLLSGGVLTFAYSWASWLSWVLNLVWAEWYLQRHGRSQSERQAIAALKNF